MMVKFDLYDCLKKMQSRNYDFEIGKNGIGVGHV